LRVLIVGAGIAGLSCALRLLRQGHEVAVAERQKGPIDRVCGEGILPFGVELLEEIGMADAIRQAGQSFDGIAYHRGDRVVSAGFAAGRCGIGIERGDLDRLLREACARHEHFSLRSGLRIHAGETADADLVLAADGIQSSFRRHHGRLNRPTGRLGFRLRVDVPPPDRVQVHFFNCGEIYFTPTGPQTLSVAFLLERAKIPVPGAELEDWCLAFFKRSFPQYASCRLHSAAARAPIAATPKGAPPPLHLLGDADRAFEPISGAGMSVARLCGKLAAEHLNDVPGYYAALAPVTRSVRDFTRAVLFFRGGGWRTGLMLRQLAKAPRAFERILALHNGRDRFWALGSRHLLSLVNPL